MKYAKLEKNGMLTYAPRILYDDNGVYLHPTMERYALFGWLPLHEDWKPSEPSENGKHWVRRGWIVKQGEIFPSYEQIDDFLPSSRTFSKLKLESELFERGLLATLDEFIDSQMITNEYGQTMPLRRKYDTANDFREDYPAFKEFYSIAKSKLGIDDEEAEQILSASMVD